MTEEVGSNPGLTVPIERANLRRLVHERVREAILTGELGPGERFTETRLAEGLGTSRAPVREALRELEQQGLIVPAGQRGYQLRPITPDEVEELALLRIALERLAANLVTKRASDESLGRLQEIVDIMMSLGEDDLVVRDKLDSEFHEVLVEASQHALLLRSWLSLRDQQVLALRAMNLAWPTHPGFAPSHQRVVDALLSRNAEKAEEAIRVHIETGVTRLREIGSTPRSLEEAHSGRANAST